MPKFTKAQYDHIDGIKSMLRQCIHDSGPDVPPALTIEEMVKHIQDGTAQLNLSKVFREDGTCSHAFSYVQDVFDFPGDDERQTACVHQTHVIAQRIEKMKAHVLDIQTRFVFGVIDGEQAVQTLKALLAMTPDELNAFIDQL
jgi:hypothetical protein